MTDKTYLIKTSINHILELIVSLGDGQIILPSDIELAKTLKISRTSIRIAIKHLCDEFIIERVGRHKFVMRQPSTDDYFDVHSSDSTKDVTIEKYFLELIHSGQLLPGQKFSELELAKGSGCVTVTVREFLIKFSSYGLIEKIPRAGWKMTAINQELVEELISFRQIVEMNSVSELVKLPSSHPIWQKLHQLLLQHQEIKADISNRYMEFNELDRILHLNIQQASKNRFTARFFDIVSFVCHYHYQWGKAGEFKRIEVAIDEHIELLLNLVSNNQAGAILTMQKHLNSTKNNLVNCIGGLSNE